MFSARVPFWYQSATGGFGNSGYFPNNASQLLSTPNNTLINMANWKRPTGFTVEYWIYPVAWPGSINPGPGNQDGGGTNYWSFGPAAGSGSTGQLEFYYWGPGTNYVRSPSNALTLNAWNAIAFTANTTTGSVSTVSMYINGTRQSISLNGGASGPTVTISNGAFSTSTPFAMGRYGANRWNAYVDTLRVSDINRYSGLSSYTLATSPFTSDANTLLLMTMGGTPGSTSFPDTSGYTRTVTNASSIVTVSATHANHT